MKKAFLLLVALVFVASMAAPVLAAHDPIMKLKDGTKTVISVPYDIGKTTLDEMKTSDFKPFGLMGGLLKGIAYGVKDVVTGAVDIVTFPIDLKK